MASVTTTAAPKTKAVASIKVINGETGKPLPKANVEITGIASGKSDANGSWTSKPFLAGSYDVKVFLTAFGPEPPPGLPRAEWTWIQNVIFPAVTNSAPKTKVEVKLFQALPCAAIKVENGKDQKPVNGVQLSAGSLFSDKTDASGQLVTKGITPGTYAVTAKKPGWGAVGATKPGDVTKSVSFAGTANVPVQFTMVNIWGKVKSSNITVKGKNFVDWFNNDFTPPYPARHATIIYPVGEKARIFPNKVSKSAFDNIFDYCSEIFAPELSVEEFVAIFLIMYNESGFLPRMEGDYLHSESKAMKYFFGTSGGKASYNAPPNRQAGDQLTDPSQRPGKMLVDAGISLTEAEKKAWNNFHGGPYPNPDPNSVLFSAAKECDFYKFRGRGLIQITWRTNFKTCVDPHLAQLGLPSSEELTDAELEQHIKTREHLYRSMVGSFLKQCPTWPGVNGQTWAPFGKNLSGGGSYSQIYEYRCQELITALQKEEVLLA